MLELNMGGCGNPKKQVVQIKDLTGNRRAALNQYVRGEERPGDGLHRPPVLL